MPAGLLLAPLSSVLFEDKFQFSTRQSLPYERHECFSFPKADVRDDIWSVKAPDFSVKLYRSVSGPREKKAKTLKPRAEGTTRVTLPKILPEKERGRMETPKFRAFYRPPGGLEEELQFVKSGKYPAERYRNPKPHDFRPLDEEVPDFITTFDKDPGNLKIRLKTLDTIHHTPLDRTDRERTSNMDTLRPADPQWDPSLLLPVGPWPPKSASYTRHRRRREAYSAFLERVEEKLTRSWQKT